MKIERTRIHFFSDVFAARSPYSDLKVPNMVLEAGHSSVPVHVRFVLLWERYRLRVYDSL